jgi:hypothetical protein
MNIKTLVVALLLSASAFADAPRIRLNPPAGGGGGGGGDAACELPGGADCIMTGPVRASDGSAAEPSLTFASDFDNGFYYIGANSFGLSVGGTLRDTYTTTSISTTLLRLGPNGTAGGPAWSFSGDPNTGAYNVGADQLGFATNGTLRLTLSTSALTSTLPYVSPLGAVGAPALAPVGGLTTGVWFPTTAIAAISASGTEAMRFAATFVQTVLPLYYELPTVNQASSLSVTSSNSGAVYNNSGATAQVVFTLPTATQANTTYTFCVVDADGIAVRTNNTTNIVSAGAITTDTTGTISSAAVGNCLTVVYTGVANAEWVTTSVVGTWTTT